MIENSHRLILYTGPHCTLCEKAKQEIWPVIGATGHQLQEVDITSDVTLLRRYRLSIPVLAKADGTELGWPFEQGELFEWLQA